jgi:hypothetical protein
MDERNIYSTVYDLQNFTTRYYGLPGNVAASTYLYNRLRQHHGLTVEYQGGELRNEIATLPGKDPSSAMLMVGAHYDSTSDEPSNAPERATTAEGWPSSWSWPGHEPILFQPYPEVRPVEHEEGGLDTAGSAAYVKEAVADHDDIMLYFNYDSSCLDPRIDSSLI